MLSPSSSISPVEKTRKIVLLGSAGSGKTSLKNIVFSDYSPDSCVGSPPTHDVDQHHVKYLGSLMLHIWDCGGQTGYMEDRLNSQRTHFFGRIDVLVYVFEVESAEWEKDLCMFRKCVEALYEEAPEAKIVVMVNKMDLVEETIRDETFEEKRKAINAYAEIRTRRGPINVVFDVIGTTIWNCSVYNAWSRCMELIVPKAPRIEEMLRKMGEIIEAREVTLFEKQSLLKIHHIEIEPQRDDSILEKTTQALKSFKNDLLKKAAGEAHTKHIFIGDSSVHIADFTENIIILINLKNETLSIPVLTFNIQYLQKRIADLDCNG
ncbi:unnamed protein product [Caenorhabditis sp. 36 PRJEB53466]|nr:unnamed protein product [Caenorhabditis sp. 36 PRJEB53466]